MILANLRFKQFINFTSRLYHSILSRSFFILLRGLLWKFQTGLKNDRIDKIASLFLIRKEVFYE